MRFYAPCWQPAPLALHKLVVCTLYMKKLADKVLQQIKVSVLNKGTKRVAANIPAQATNAPRLQVILDLLVATGSPAGVRDQFEALVTSWVETFNARLADKVAGNKHTVLVDLYTAIEDQIAKPVKVRFDQCCYTCLLSCSCWRRLCRPCILTAWKLVQPMHCLSIHLLQVKPGNWWQTYFWADDIHPTPLGHTLMSQFAA